MPEPPPQQAEAGSPPPPTMLPAMNPPPVVERQQLLVTNPTEESAVRVALRARPLIEKEIVEKCGECVTYSPDCRQIVLGKDRRFTFDYVFGPMVGQEEVYMDCVKPLVDSCVAGYAHLCPSSVSRPALHMHPHTHTPLCLWSPTLGIMPTMPADLSPELVVISLSLLSSQRCYSGLHVGCLCSICLCSIK